MFGASTETIDCPMPKSEMSEVAAVVESLSIPTYPVGAPEKNPVFFEKRVYQGSSGKVYPVPFIDKVFDEARDETWRSVRLENEFVRLVMLPEIGGRIFLGQDKTNDDYDFFYRQDVVKPALVGLAGPWISGGVEFNWPQHHRPGTFLPTDWYIEEELDGARTVWLSEHDPLHRLKGMHGIRLRPGSSLVELRARLYNRTPFVRTFLWWANVAAMVHDEYQSFFPPDVHYVADHAVRAMSSFPEARNPYYGVHYEERPGANRLDWYKNIPVPTSYMVCQTAFDFFGGYDHRAGGGFVHVADRHIAPGKKQWTWGNHEFGWAWDRELTDRNGPYVELMAGVYTDNQPDFTYLLPYETKTFSQYWWPIRGIGPVQQANTRAALRMTVREEDRTLELGLNVSGTFSGELHITRNGETLGRFPVSLEPGGVWRDESLKFAGEKECELLAELRDDDGGLVLAYRPPDPAAFTRDRDVATEPPPPEEIESGDELYLTGEHLEQYRHPTRDPELYWNEALRRDPGDARCNVAIGRRLLDRGLLDEAARHFEAAVARLTRRHPNPVTGEAHYHLGLVRFFQDRLDEAGDAFAKAAWNYEWRSAAHYQIACIACRRGEEGWALHHLDESLATNRGNHKAMVLAAAVLRRRGQGDSAWCMVEDVLAKDPLDHWAWSEWSLMDGDFEEFLERCRNDAQTILDIVFDYVDAGFFDEARRLLELHHENEVASVAVPNPAERTPMTAYVRAWLARGTEEEGALLDEARRQSPDRFFPSRRHEQTVLEWALSRPGPDPVAAYALGNLYYDVRRREDAIRVWERAREEMASPDSPVPPISQVRRNLGIAYWNTRRDGEAARAEYQAAIALDPDDARLVSEFDQLRAKLNDPLEDRLAFLEEHRDLVLRRDDASVSLASLHNLLGRPEDALALLLSRRFHPWEGGEGAVLRQYTTARILLGRRALENGDAAAALEEFSKAMDTPDSLGEKYHLLQAKADVNYWLGRALEALGRGDEARERFEASASESGDFTEMAVADHSPLSYYRGLSLRALGRGDEASTLFEDLKSFGEAGLKETAKIDYFATSLPNLLVFDEDLQARRDAENHLLIALACKGLGRDEEARRYVEKIFAFSRADLYANMEFC